MVTKILVSFVLAGIFCFWVAWAKISIEWMRGLVEEVTDPAEDPKPYDWQAREDYNAQIIPFPQNRKDHP